MVSGGRRVRVKVRVRAYGTRWEIRYRTPWKAPLTLERFASPRVGDFALCSGC